MYQPLNAVVPSLTMASTPEAFASHVVPFLVATWLDDYGRPDADVVEVVSEGFSYLFDVTEERLIAAWGVSEGPNHEPRDAQRMRGHPLSAGPHYHRGHAIAHSLGGPTDINLVPQRGAINVGPFRKLEIEAVATPGALYFSYWRYPADDSQTPIGVDQGLIVPGRTIDVRSFPN